MDRYRGTLRGRRAFGIASELKWCLCIGWRAGGPWYLIETVEMAG
jgi:hypothetical protein